ncbi:MAG: AzlD domain-containing protein [Cyanobacteria bacterium P01_D01_bin.123]
MNEWLLLLGMLLVTFGIRYSMFAASDRVTISPLLKMALQYVPPAVLTAIAVPTVLLPDGEHFDLSYLNARLVGAIAACLIGWYRKNLLLTIIVGMGAFLGWQWLVSQ